MIYSINEGQQAEEYKKRKADEQAEKNKENPRLSKTVGAKHGFNPNKPDEDASDKDLQRSIKVQDAIVGELENRYKKVSSNMEDDNAYRHVKNMGAEGTAAAIDARNRWERRHESYGIFYNVEFLNEASFSGKRKIIKSEDYAKLKELQKKYKDDKNPDTRVQLMEEAIKVTDRLIEAAKSIPADNPLEWIARFVIRQFDDPIRILWNIMGYSVFKLTAHMTRDDFIEKLLITREKLVEKLDKNKRKIERHS